VQNDAFVFVEMSHSLEGKSMNGILEVGLFGVNKQANILFYRMLFEKWGKIN
jgi:hypothetical protein